MTSEGPSPGGGGAQGEGGPVTLRRIVLALHPSSHGRAALDAAARLASFLGLELRGVYVQEERLMRLPGGSFLREVDAVSGRVRRLEASDVQRQVRAEAARAQRELSRVAGQLRLRWSFLSSRGEVAAVVRQTATPQDLISLGAGTRRYGRTTGSTVRALLATSGVPVMVSRTGMRLGPHVHVVDDGSEAGRRAVAWGRILTGREGTRLTIHVTAREGGAERASAYREELRAAGRPGDEVRLAPGRGATAPLSERECGLLVLPRSVLGRDGDELDRLLRHSTAPVLVV